jgi:hypothetical protein
LAVSYKLTTRKIAFINVIFILAISSADLDSNFYSHGHKWCQKKKVVLSSVKAPSPCRVRAWVQICDVYRRVLFIYLYKLIKIQARWLQQFIKIKKEEEEEGNKQRTSGP